MSKLARSSSFSSYIPLISSAKSLEFCTWCSVFLARGDNSRARSLDSWYDGVPMLATMGRSGTDGLWREAIDSWEQAP